MATFDGTIEIQSWDKPEVLVEIEKRGPTRESVNALEIKSSQDGDTIDVEVPKPNRPFPLSACAVAIGTFERVAAAAKRSQARSGDGHSRPALNGQIDLHTGDGSIRATEIAGDGDVQHRRWIDHRR